MGAVTLALAKEQLDIPAADTSQDVELQRYVDSIMLAVEDYKREVIERRTITERLRLTGRMRFRLWHKPVISLTSLVALDGSRTWDVSPSAMLVDGTTGLVDVLGGDPPTGRVLVTYQAGYATVPPNYVRGALIVLQHTWETQRPSSVGERVVSGAVGSEESRDMRYMYTFPRKAREWLGAPNPVTG